MFGTKLKKPKDELKLTLIPIMDAVFIFIFFLLMSAQFIEIYEVGTDAPSVKTLTEEKKQKDPLALTLKISKRSIVITTGLDEKVEGTITKKGLSYNLDELNKILIPIKVRNISESSIILKPSRDVPYHDIIAIIDAVREPKNKKQINAKDETGKVTSTDKLFDQIIFDTVI